MTEIKRPSAKEKLLAEVKGAQSIGEITAIRNKISPLQEYARLSRQSLDDVNDLAESRVEAECKGGSLLRNIERTAGARMDLVNQPDEVATSSTDLTRLTPYQSELREAGLSREIASRWQVMSWSPSIERSAYYEKTRSARRTITSEDVYRIGKKSMPHDDIQEPAKVDGKYDVIIIDPPWPMQKIERDVAPHQAGFDYPTMSEEEITAMKVPDMMAEDCHMFMWTTQKFLPMAERIVAAWGIKYILFMVWHKPGGFQPFGLPQYNCEFVLYGRKGTPEFVDTKDFMCCFNAPRREHSRKPDEFYDTIRRVTAGRRIDVFSREVRDGFDQYGNETQKFSGAA